LGAARAAPTAQVGSNHAALFGIEPVCGQFVLEADQTPSKCLVTGGCTGKPVKVGEVVTAKQ
jgi:hypothetical protein